MATLAVSASLIGHFAVAGYKAPFLQTVNVDLPNLIATSRLAQDAVSMTANAPALVLARSQSVRRDAMARVEEQVESMKSLVGHFPEGDVAIDTVQYVVKQGAVLVDNLKVLDRRVDERIELDLALGRGLAELRSLEASVGAVAPPSWPGGDAVRDWKLSAQHTLVHLALTAGAMSPSELEALRSEVAGGVDQTLRLSGSLPSSLVEQARSLSRSIEALGSGDAGLPALKTRRLAVGDQIRALMNRNKVLSDEMAALVASVASSIEGTAMSRSSEVIRSSERQSLLLVVIAGICIGGAVLVILDINRSVIRRLRALVAIMMNAVKGRRTLVIPIQADDEIGELGRAFQFFVATIEMREAALRGSEQRLADIINLLPDATVVIDLEGKVLFWNHAVEVMTGIPAAEIVGKGDYEYALPFYGKRRPILVDMALRADAFIPGAYSMFEVRGDTIWAETSIDDLLGRPVSLRGSASVVRNSDGKVVGAIETIFDITERRVMIDDLRKAKDVAERASQSKSVFLATMSHELRTPLNSIIGFADFVSTEIFGPVGNYQYVEHAEYARQSAQHLLDIINGILDLSKIEAGMVKLELVRVPVASTVTRSVRMVQDLALGSHIVIKTAIPPKIPDLWADERAMRQILINLLGNAIKFNVDGGSILVTVLEAGDFIEVVVADTGAGIPANEIERVLKPFEQIDNQYSRTQGGTGLGLSIVEGLVALHGGTLTIASAVGKGTAVTVRLPCARDPAGR